MSSRKRTLTPTRFSSASSGLRRNAHSDSSGSVRCSTAEAEDSQFFRSSNSIMTLPSARPIPVRDRLILALDTKSSDEAIALVDRLGDSVQFYKIGLSLVFDRGF